MKQIVLRRRPPVWQSPKKSCFGLEEIEIPTLSRNQIQVQVYYLGMAPVIVRYLNNQSTHATSISIGDCIPGRGVGRVVKSTSHKYKIGDIVQGPMGWREYATISATSPLLWKMNDLKDLSPVHGVGSMGISGFTVLTILEKITKVKKGSSILVTACAGGIGSQIAQMAKIMGAKEVIGICGSEEKCKVAVNKLGYDYAINYKTDDIQATLTELFPYGIKLFIDNVGGPILDTVLKLIAKNATLVMCGSIYDYLRPERKRHKYKNIFNLALMDSELKAFFVYDYKRYFTKYERKIATYLRSGELCPLIDYSYGIESAPDALLGLYQGKNYGIKVVELNK